MFSEWQLMVRSLKVRKVALWKKVWYQIIVIKADGTQTKLLAQEIDEFIEPCDVVETDL